MEKFIPYEKLSKKEKRKIDTTPLITHRFKLQDIEEAYHIFENKLDGVIRVSDYSLKVVRREKYFAAHYIFRNGTELV